MCVVELPVSVVVEVPEVAGSFDIDEPVPLDMLPPDMPGSDDIDPGDDAPFDMLPLVEPLVPLDIVPLVEPPELLPLAVWAIAVPATKVAAAIIKTTFIVTLQLS